MASLLAPGKDKHDGTGTAARRTNVQPGVSLIGLMFIDDM